MSTKQGAAASARTIAHRLIAERTLVLASATAVLVAVGVIGTIADEYGLVLLCILALQATIAGYLLTAPETRRGGGDSQAAIDRASARTLTDLAHTRQTILDAIAQMESAPNDPRAT